MALSSTGQNLYDIPMGHMKLTRDAYWAVI